jgi:hypothetical protein
MLPDGNARVFSPNIDALQVGAAASCASLLCASIVSLSQDGWIAGSGAGNDNLWFSVLVLKAASQNGDDTLPLARE